MAGRRKTIGGKTIDDASSNGTVGIHSKSGSQILHPVSGGCTIIGGECKKVALGDCRAHVSCAGWAQFGVLEQTDGTPVSATSYQRLKRNRSSISYHDHLKAVGGIIGAAQRSWAGT